MSSFGLIRILASFTLKVSGGTGARTQAAISASGMRKPIVIGLPGMASKSYFISVLATVISLASCSSPSNPADEFRNATAIILQNRTGQPPPAWLILRAGSAVSLGLLAIGGMSVTICQNVDKECSDYTSGDGEYIVDRVVPYGTLGLYAIHLSQLGWVGGGDIAPVVPAGVVLQNRLCSEESGQGQADCSHDIDSDPNAGGDITHVPDYTLLKVDSEKPGHINYLQVVAISGSIAGTTGFVGDDYETPSGYDPGQFVSVVVTR